jgi:hypothetical protein
MPFKSKAQRRLFWAKAEKGDIPASTVREWEHATKNKSRLPEHVNKVAYIQGVKTALDVLGLHESIDPEDLPRVLAKRKREYLEELYRLNAATGLPAGGYLSEEE